MLTSDYPMKGMNSDVQTVRFVCRWVAYLGAANAGIPLSIIVKEFGWNAYFSTLIGCCALALCLLAPMVNLQSHVQREKARIAGESSGGTAAAAA